MQQDDLGLEEEECCHIRLCVFCSVSLAPFQQRRGLFAGTLYEPSERERSSDDLLCIVLTGI